MDDHKTVLNVQFRQLRPFQMDVSLSCKRGEVLALVGPSGGGKTSILRAIAGLNTPHEGEIVCAGDIWFDSKTDQNLPVHKRKCGYVFQSYALFPHMTALENVASACPMQHKSDRVAKAGEWLEFVQLSGFVSYKPEQLSGGQQQRVALARALAREPSVLLLDEPFSALDRRTRRELKQEIARLRLKLSIPILLVSHDIDEVLELADTISVIEAGKSVALISSAELLDMDPLCRVRQILDF